ncbi:MAG: PAS domain S-box protein [Limisphaerales bacterium]
MQPRLAAIIERADDAILSMTLEGQIQTWNPQAERMFGYRAEEVIGQSVARLIASDRAGEEDQVLERLKRGEPIDHYETGSKPAASSRRPGSTASSQ